MTQEARNVDYESMVEKYMNEVLCTKAENYHN